MASAPSRLEAIPVANDSRTKPPGARRMRCRRLTIGSSTAPVVPESGASVERHGILGAAAAAQEARAVGLPFHRPLHPPLDAQHVDRPHARLVRERGPPGADQGGALGQVLGLDEQLAEGRVGQVVGRRGQRRSRRSS